MENNIENKLENKLKNLPQIYELLFWFETIKRANLKTPHQNAIRRGRQTDEKNKRMR